MPRAERALLLALLCVGCEEEPALYVARFDPPPPVEEVPCPGAEDNGLWQSVELDVEAGLGAIWGSGPSDVWAVGGAGTIVHFDGVEWSALPVITPIDLRGVHGSSREQVWAVGRGGLVLHFAGSAWTRVESGLSADLLAVWVLAADDVWIASSEGPIHWDGTRFHQDPSWPSTAVHGVWASGPDEVWMIGATSHHRWNGRSFESERIESAGLLSAIWGTGAERWIIGHSSGSRPGFGERDGVEWSFGAAPPRAVFFTLWSIDPAQLWVGANDASIFLRRDGTWCREHLGGSGAINGFWGASHQDVWSAGAVRGPDGRTLPLLLRRRAS